jgi:hypothetical protein
VLLDLIAGRAFVATQAGLDSVALTAPDLPRRLAEFRAALAADQQTPWSPSTAQQARALGRDLLGPLAPALQAATAWEIAPLQAAPLGALIPPWSAADEPVQAAVTVWYRPASTRPAGAPGAAERSACVPSPEQQASMPRNEGVLAIAPFTPGAQPGRDDPDTLVWAMRKAARTVDLVPRNDSGPDAIQGAFAERKYGVTWLRADPQEAHALLPALDRGPLLLWWSLPVALTAAKASASGGAGAGTPEGAPFGGGVPVTLAPPSAPAGWEFARDWAAGVKGLAMDLWPRPHQASSAGATAFLEALQQGSGAADALRAGCEALRRAGAPAAQWAGWIYVGNPDLTAQIDRPGWLQRAIQSKPGAQR